MKTQNHIFVLGANKSVLWWWWVSDLTRVNVTSSYGWRIRCEARKASGGSACTAQPSQTCPACRCSLFFSHFFNFLQKGAIDIRRKTDGVGAEQGNGRGVGCLEPSVNSWEVWFHRLAPPCQGSDWAGQEAQERPGLLKDTNRWEAALEGGAPGGIEKGRSPRPATIHRPETEEDGWWRESRGAEGDWGSRRG